MKQSCEQTECAPIRYPEPHWPDDDRYVEEKRQITLLMSRAHRGHFKSETPDGFTSAEVFTLVFIDDQAVGEEPVRSGVLARTLHFKPSALSQMLKTLEQKGCIERHRGSVDNRVVEITLTDRGREIVAQTHAIRNEQWNRLFDYLGQEDVAHLMRIAARICEFQNQNEDAR